MTLEFSLLVQSLEKKEWGWREDACRNLDTYALTMTLDLRPYEAAACSAIFKNLTYKITASIIPLHSRYVRFKTFLQFWLLSFSSRSFNGLPVMKKRRKIYSGSFRITIPLTSVPRFPIQISDLEPY